MAHLRIRIGASGVPLVTCVMEIGGSLFEEVLDGVGQAELVCIPSGSIVRMGMLAQAVEVISERLPSRAEDTPSEHHGLYPAAH